MNRGAGRVSLFGTLLVVLVLMGVVAVASSGSTPTGTDDARPPSDVLFDTIFSLGLVLLIPAAVILVYGLMQRKAIAHQIASGKYPRTSIVGFLGIMLLVAAFGYWGVHQRGTPRDELADFLWGNEVSRPPPKPGVVRGTYEAEFAWIPVLVVVALAAIGIGAYVVADRRRRPALAADDAVAAEEVADDLDDSLDELRAEPDPRRAVVAAYARLERALAASGLPRYEQETAEEYVGRVLGRLEVDPGAVRELTDLYEPAKFSQHDVSQTMKDDAIAALALIRDELRAAARRRAEERSLALASKSEQAATA